MKTYRTASGLLVSANDQVRLGRGGEGVVLPVAKTPHLVAKIFHRPTRQRLEKLQAMLSHPLPQSESDLLAAWPLEIVYRDSSREYCGYTMPRIIGAKTIFCCYNPSQRRRDCPGFNYRYLVAVSRNLAASVSRVHSTGRFIVGDLNESNILVMSNAVVRFIDTDSWQIWDSARGFCHLCPVAKAEYLPPNLQGANLQCTNRHHRDDDFALAILIFKLLNEGTHPFDGVFTGPGEPPPIEARIAAGQFPYAGNHHKQWTPKPLAPPFAGLHPSIQTMFLNCFQDCLNHGQRPAACDWQKAIDEATGALVVCSRNPNHWFWGDHCTWCQRATQLGRDPFPPTQPVQRLRVPAASCQRPPPIEEWDTFVPGCAHILSMSFSGAASRWFGLAAYPNAPTTMKTILELNEMMERVFTYEISHLDQHPFRAGSRLLATLLTAGVAIPLAGMLWVLNLLLRIACLGVVALLLLVRELLTAMRILNQNP